MLTCTLDQKNMESLSTVVGEKNKLSLLNRFSSKDFTDEDMKGLNKIGIVDKDGFLLDNAQPAINILSNPYAVVKFTFTGGAGIFEHNINYDNSFRNHVTITITPNDFNIDDEVNPQSILPIFQDFVGKSNLKSINISGRYTVTEALVIASILDIERRAFLRAFVDEVPISRNSYTANLIWRIINSTSNSMQWFVSVMNDVIGEHVVLTPGQVQEGINGLIAKDVMVQNGGQYSLTGELAGLSSRMIIIDNILSTHIHRLDESKEVVSTGFTCIQSGVHDLLFLDFDGNEVVFETISSVALLEYLEQFFNCKAYFA